MPIQEIILIISTVTTSIIAIIKIIETTKLHLEKRKNKIKLSKKDKKLLKIKLKLEKLNKE